MPAGPRPRYWGHTDPRTIGEVIAHGQRIGVPEVTVEEGLGDSLRVIYRWAHGDTIIYPTGDLVTETNDPGLGWIGLVKMKGHVGRVIRAAQWLNGDGYEDYQHAFTNVGGGWIIEAMPGGALLSPLSRYADQKILWLKCPREYGEAVADAARSFGPQYGDDGKLLRKGVPYSFADYAALALHRFKIPTPLLKRYIERSKSMICSQLCDRAAELGGWKIFSDGRWHGDVTPGDLTRVAFRQMRIVR